MTERPDSVPARVWARLTPKERTSFVEHERMHREFRERLGLEHLSAEDIFNMVMK